MSGDLPMKVIKVASGAQSRIAQACDRCRSKKIRCDGIRPCCTQCASVGFECRTSDKLSRRAFPRGYTESLEERVRQLEAEVKELKDLVDEKEEKIDMLSRMHSQRQVSVASTTSPQVSTESPTDQVQTSKEDTFRVKNSPILLELENSECRFVGPSSGYFLMEMLKSRLQDSGRQVPEFEPQAYLHVKDPVGLADALGDDQPALPIPRLFSDKCVNIYFQEWAPLFPVLHKSTFLRTYEEFIADADAVKDNHKLAQLYLVFSIASLSSGTTELELVASCERQWQLAIDAIIMDNSMATLQCLVLALMDCQLQANHKRMQYYKGIAVTMSHRLGLHQDQKASSFGSLSVETRKKVFWTLYTLDCFSAARSGLPKLLNDDDVHVAYPVDTDDEYITESGFQPTLPGEVTKVSSALALFKAARVLSKVLVELYPSSASHEISFQQISALDAELLDWKNNLPPHLQLDMIDKPSTDATSSRAPILALAYYSIRTLIHRQGFASNVAPKAASSGIAVSECVKHTVQTIKLLDERRLSFSFCFNKTDTMVIAFFTLLYLSLDVHPESKMMKALGRVTNELLEMLIKHNITGILHLQQAASQLVPLRSATIRISSQPPSPAPLDRKTQQARGSASQLSSKTTRPQPVSSVSDSNHNTQQGRPRRVTMSNDSDTTHNSSTTARSSLDLGSFESPVGDGASCVSAPIVPKTMRSASARTARPGLDYLSFDQAPADFQASPASAVPNSGVQVQDTSAIQPMFMNAEPPQKFRQRADVSVSEWEALLGAMDGGQIYHAIYGGGPSLSGETPSSTSNAAAEWSPDGWDLSSFHITGDMAANMGPTPGTVPMGDANSLSSGDEFATTDMFAGITPDDFHMHGNSQNGMHGSQHANLDTGAGVQWSYTDPWTAPPDASGH